MRGHGRSVRALSPGALWLLLAAAARAGEGETRAFTICVDGTGRPAAELRERTLSWLDATAGRALAGRLQRVGPARLIVSGQTIDCTHYRVTGQAQADLWYDARDRLVRQETLEDGHRTVLVLKEL